MDKTTLTNWALLMCLVFLWGTSFMFVSVSVETVDPLSIVFFRVFLGAFVLTIIVHAMGLRLPLSLTAWLVFLAFGIVGNVLPFFLISWGQQSVNSGVAGMIMAIMPLMTMLLAHYFVEGENLNRYKVIGFTLGITGITILLGPVFEGGGRAVLSGFAIFIAATSYAVNSILVRRLPQFNPIVAGAGMLIAATITLLPVWWLLAPEFGVAVSTKSTIAVIWLGIGPTGIASVILFTVIKRAGPTFLSTINYMLPVVAFFTGAIVLSEPIEWHSILALITILSGIALTRFRASNAQPVTENSPKASLK
jgi:drug/metabolite transporter (DMT)-like permease